MAYGSRQGAADRARAEMLEPNEELSSVLREEAAQSVGLDGDAIADDQIRAFERYIGKDYGDEQDGMSRVHTREVFETIEWMRPDMARIFAAGPGCIEVEFPDDPTGEKAEQASALLYWRIFGEGDGLGLVDSFFFNGALQKIGVICVDWEEDELGSPETLEALTVMEAQKVAADPSVVELLDTQVSETSDAEGQELYDVTVQKVKRKAHASMKVVAPEDFRVSKRATNLERPFYCGYSLRMYLSDIVEMWPDQEGAIREAASSAQQTMEMDERRMARFELDEEGLDTRHDHDEGEVLLECEFVHYDLDGDGFVELVECYRIGSLVLEAEEAEENNFACWSPIRIPHKLIGLSIADIVMDVQRTQTVLLRSSLNGSQMAVAPRMAVSDHVNLTDLLTVRIGALVRLKQNAPGPVKDHVHPITVPDVAGSALNMMEKVDRIAEARTGVTRNAQGLNPDVLHKTMGGVALLQNAASVRKEMCARNLAEGLSMAFTKFLRLEIRHGEKRQKIGNGKSQRDVDLSQWSPDVRVKVHVGQGTGNREAQLMNLMQLAQMQDAFVTKYGDAQPIVTPRHRYNTTEQITRAMGFSSAEPFFADPDKLDDQGKAMLAKMMEPKPDPKVAEAMQKLQADQQQFMAKLQQDQQQFMAKLAAERQEHAEEMAFDLEKLGEEVRLAETEIIVDAEQKNERQSAAGGPNVRTGGDKV